jgi:regulator of protease activity HflC (stomatin/prohibitin superfamily)
MTKIDHIIGVVIVCAIVLGGTCLHKIDEGNIGIRYEFGRLTDMNYSPGIKFSLPYPINIFSQVNIRPQTDTVEKIYCGTNDGLILTFDTIDVGNTLPENKVNDVIRKYGEDYDRYLVKDKIRHQINVICSTLSFHEVFIEQFDDIDNRLFNFLQEQNVESGLIINFVRLTKPNLPPQIKSNYERIAEERTALKVEMDTQERKKKQAETEKLVAQINNQKMIEQKETEAKIAKINNDMLMDKKKAEADAEKYRLETEAAGMEKLLNVKGYLELKQAEYLTANSKVYFGNIPATLFVESADKLKLTGNSQTH